MADGKLWWDDLSDSELRSRLVNRGVSLQQASYMVSQRDRSAIIRRQISQKISR